MSVCLSSRFLSVDGQPQKSLQEQGCRGMGVGLHSHCGVSLAINAADGVACGVSLTLSESPSEYRVTLLFQADNLQVHSQYSVIRLRVGLPLGPQ